MVSLGIVPSTVCVCHPFIASWFHFHCAVKFLGTTCLVRIPYCNHCHLFSSRYPVETKGKKNLMVFWNTSENSIDCIQAKQKK